MSAGIYVWGVEQVSCPKLASASRGNQTGSFPAGWRLEAAQLTLEVVLGEVGERRQRPGLYVRASKRRFQRHEGIAVQN